MGYVVMECEDSSTIRTEPGLGQPACCSNVKAENRNRKEQSDGRYYRLKCADGDFGELRLDRILNFHCKSMPTRACKANPADNMVLKRGSVYHSSSEVSRMRKPKEGRRKIDSRTEGDAFLSFEIVDSLPQPGIRQAVLCSRLKQPPPPSSAEQPPASETVHPKTRNSMEFLELSFHDLPGKAVRPDCSSVGNPVLKSDLNDGFLEICLENENTTSHRKNSTTGFPERGLLKGLKPNDHPLHKSFSAKDGNLEMPCRSSVLHAIDVKAQSSPLKRMLDPIMKSKSLRSSPLVETEAMNNLHTAMGMRNAVSRKSLLHDFSKTTQKMESNGGSGREDQPSAATSSLAHLHATLKPDRRNGASTIEFFIMDPEEVLSAKTWKTDSALNWVYTFHGRSKRTTSTGRSSKDKHGFSPPIVGQMQASCYLCSESVENGDAIDSIVSEFVLYDIAQARRSFAIDNPDCNASTSYPWSQADLHPHLEIASVVIEIPVNKTGHVNNMKSELGNSCVDQRRPVTIKAITSSGPHGLPSTDGGSPSSVLDRWRHGGGCDCGGWDMACPVVVFKNEYDDRQANNMTKESKRPLVLFVQGSKEKAPALTIATDEKGQYTIDFHAQLSALQAFSICVAFLHGLKTSPPVGQEKSKHKLCSSSLKLLFKEEVRNLIEAVADEEKKKTKKKVEPVPPLFVPDPPFSPMGRL